MCRLNLFISLSCRRELAGIHSIQPQPNRTCIRPPMQCGGCFASREQYLSFRLKKQIVKVLRSEFTERRAPLCPKMEYLSNTPGSNYPVANGGKGYKSRRLALIVLAIYTDSGSSRYLQKMDSLVSCDRKRGKHNMNLIRRIQHISPRSSFGSGTKHVSQ